VAERVTPLELPPDEFRRLGHDLVDRIADFLGSLRERPLTSGETPAEIRALLGRAPLPRTGTTAAALLPDTARLLFDHSLFNGHPRFWGYVTSSAAPLGALADLLAATVNPNVGGWELSPVASEIEAQTVRCVAELVGYPVDCGGLLVSGGNMVTSSASWPAGGRCSASRRERRAFAAEVAARSAWAHRPALTPDPEAADLWLRHRRRPLDPTDGAQRMRTDALRERSARTLARGDRPIMVVGTAAP
jgi:glutamate/tyrosine decarboxylase-like PLP-dependent enzyme